MDNPLTQRLSQARDGLKTKVKGLMQRTAALRGVEYGVRFLAGLILSNTTVFGNYAPFGVSMVAASGPGARGFSALAGALLGYALRGGYDMGLKYGAMCILVYAAAFVFWGTRPMRTTWFMPAIAAFMAAATGAVYAMDAAWRLTAVVLYITETILVGGAAYFYRFAFAPAKSGEGEQRRNVSLLILLATLYIALVPLELFHMISVGRLLASLTVLVIAAGGGMGAGAAAGVAMGLAMDCAGAFSPFYSMAYAFSGCLAGVFYHHSRLLFTLTYILANAVSVLWTYSPYTSPAVLYEVFVTSVVFMLLPASSFRWTARLAGSREASISAARARAYTQSRVERLALVFRDLHDRLRKAGVAHSKNDDDIAKVFDRTADQVCKKCVHKNLCWNRDYLSTLSAMNDTTAALTEKGEVSLTDFPDYFANRCRYLEAYASTVNQEYKALLYRRQLRRRMAENYNVLYDQYAQVSQILDDVAMELGARTTFEPELEDRLARYLRSTGRQLQGAVFRDASRRLHVEIEGDDLGPLTRDEGLLDKLSALLGVRLMAPGTKKDALRLVFLEAEPLSATVGLASMRKKGQSVSGDRGTYFKTEDGTLYVALSDGMGTGQDAAKESTGAIRLLERFLKAGLGPQEALQMLNALLCIQSQEDLAAPTIDLMGISLFSGRSCLYKYGAAPSYIRRGNTISRAKGKSFAAGTSVTDNGPDRIPMNLPAGSMAVIASDGVLRDKEDKWLRELMLAYQGDSAKDLAAQVLQAASDRYGADDDMTVLAVLVQQRK